MKPLFRLSLVYADGSALPLTAGGSAERDFIALCTQHIVAHGVGVGRTEAHVTAAIEKGLTEALMTVKQDARRFL